VVGIAVLILNEAGDLGNATTDPDGSNARSTTRSSADAFIARGRGAAASPRRTVKDVAVACLGAEEISGRHSDQTPYGVVGHIKTFSSDVDIVRRRAPSN